MRKFKCTIMALLVMVIALCAAPHTAKAETMTFDDPIERAIYNELKSNEDDEMLAKNIHITQDSEHVYECSYSCIVDGYNKPFEVWFMVTCSEDLELDIREMTMSYSGQLVGKANDNVEWVDYSTCEELGISDMFE